MPIWPFDPAPANDQARAFDPGLQLLDLLLDRGAPVGGNLGQGDRRTVRRCHDHVSRGGVAA